MSYSNNNRGAAAVSRQVPVSDEISTILIDAGVNFVKRHKVLTGTYLFGLFLMVFATGFSVSMQQEKEYSKILSTIDNKKHDRAQQQVWLLEDNYYKSKGWFSCDQVCTENYALLKQAETNLYNIENEFKDITSQAKSSVGIFSEYGVSEVRGLFWEQFAGGKNFAKRSSYWDLIFMSIGSMGRDESLIEFALRFLMQMIMNFTVGMCGALVGFYWYLWGVVSSYNPGFILGMTMFILASIAATSLVASFLIGLYTAAAGSVYVAVKVGSNTARLQNQERQQQFLRAQQQQRQRQHYHQE